MIINTNANKTRGTLLSATVTIAISVSNDTYVLCCGVKMAEDGFIKLQIICLVSHVAFLRLPNLMYNHQQ